MLQLLPHLLNGVSLGLLFALIALGFMLIVGVMETINLAHGSLFALGMYVAIFIVTPRFGWFPSCRRRTSPCRSAPATPSPCCSRRWWSACSACCSSSACAAPTARIRSTGCSSPSARRW
jgi:ABC-type branched-subunit amino acid transport system permease subunit